MNVAYSVPGAPPPFPAEHVPAEDGYFSDAVFIGDSSMDDVEMFNLFPTANFVTKVGISPLSVNRREFRYAGSRELENMFDVVEKYPHKKIYILLGANSLDNKPSDQAMADYKKMMETFLERFPETIFYLIVPPAMTERVLKDLLIPPKRFANFRDMLISFAEERHCYIIDFYSLLLNLRRLVPAKHIHNFINTIHFTLQSYFVETEADPDFAVFGLLTSFKTVKKFLPKKRRKARSNRDF